MKTRIRFLLAAILGISLNACQENGEPPTASQPTITLAPRLTLSQGADTALYNSTANVLVHLDAGTVHRDTLVAFSLHRCLFEGLNPNVGFSLSFRGLNAKGDTLWRGTRSGVIGKDLSSGTTNQAVEVPVVFTDRTPPVLLVTPRDSVVAAGIGSIGLAWAMSPEPGLKISMAGATPVLDANGIISATVVLKEGANRFALIVTDSVKNTTTDTVLITRSPVLPTPDTTAPVLLTAPADTSVAATVAGLDLHWIVKPEPGLVASVNGNPALLRADTVIASVSVPSGRNIFVLSLTDSAGNANTDTVTVTRSAPSDKYAPILLQSPKDSIVPNATNTLTLSWKIQLEQSLTARLDGTLLTGAAGVYTKQVGLAEGSNHFVFVTVDSAGNSIVDTVWITREPVKDVDAPVILSAPKDTVVNPWVASMFITWKLKEEAKLSVLINGDPVAGGSGIYSKEIRLLNGKNAIKIIISDSVGNTTADSISVIRNETKDGYGIAWSPSIAYGYIHDTRDSQEYATIKIGNKEWMAENLRFRKLPTQIDTFGSCYDNLASNCLRLGRFYSWSELYSSNGNGGENICPSGWDIPSQQDFLDLFALAGSTGDSIASILGAADPNIPWATEIPGLDRFGFRAIGWTVHQSSISCINGICEFSGYLAWHTKGTDIQSGIAITRLSGSSNPNAIINSEFKFQNAPLRCVR